VVKPTAILHRTPWRPPLALSANGSYIKLEDGRTILDAVGGAAVTCIGDGHPTVIKAMKDQIDKMTCGFCTFFNPFSTLNICADVYNVQLSNEPAEELADYLVKTGHGAFALCGFVSGGKRIR